MKKLLLFILAVVALNISCVNTKDSDAVSNDPLSIEGIWSYIENDSTYGEVFFTSNHLWEYTESAGEIYLKYIQRNDSIIIMNWNGDPYISGKVTKIAHDKFSFEQRNLKTRYQKVNLLLDTARLLRGDTDYLQGYVKTGLLVRKYDWENKNRTRPL